MWGRLLFTVLTFLLAQVIYGQSALPPGGFEVASIRSSAPQAEGRVSTRMSSDPDRLNYTNVTLSDLISKAYSVEHAQISGPEWIDSDRFDILAKIPAGVKADQLPEMIEALLTDRFRLRLKREQRIMPVYLLLPEHVEKLNKAPAESGLNGNFSRGRGRVSGAVMMEYLASYLSGQLGVPVLDRTGLAGAYQVTLDCVQDAAAGTTGKTPEGEPGAAHDLTREGPDLPTALREQLGLRLEAKKAPAEVLIIESGLRTPTEN